jgi:SAM-dependent methyltransferase
MRLCITTYLDPTRPYRVLDFGSMADGPDGLTHNDLLEDYQVDVTGMDVQQGHNVDVLMSKPYRIPARANTFDVVLTGSTFEHVPFFWASILELGRVVKPGGLIFLTAPSRGHRHAAIDLWRFYPDSMRSLAAWAGLDLLEAHTDFPPVQEGSRRLDYRKVERQTTYWGDTVGVFEKPRHYSRLVRLERIALCWWANRVSGIESVKRPGAAPGRRRVAVASARRERRRAGGARTAQPAASPIDPDTSDNPDPQQTRP